MNITNAHTLADSHSGACQYPTILWYDTVDNQTVLQSELIVFEWLLLYWSRLHKAKRASVGFLASSAVPVRQITSACLSPASHQLVQPSGQLHQMIPPLRSD